MSSTNYTMQADILTSGGGYGSSTNYILDSTVADVATGETMFSTNYGLCAGYECFRLEPYVSFSVKEGTSSPGTTGAGVALGTLETTSIKTSDGSTVNSVFLTAETNAPNGGTVTVRSVTPEGLASTSVPGDTISIGSDQVTLTTGNEGYGICVYTNSQHADSPTTFVDQYPYNGSCDYSTHQVGRVQTAAQSILSSTGALKGGTAEVLVKGSRSVSTPAHSDYADSLVFIFTGTY